MTEKEAKDYLREHYKNRGFQVSKIYLVNWKQFFRVHFVDDRGPQNLPYVVCNWPEFAQ